MSVEAAIIARLTATLAPTIRVLSATALHGLKDAPTPAVHVVPWGERVLESTRGGLVVRNEETWLAVVALRNVSDLRSGREGREDAHAIKTQVRSALQGLQVNGYCTPLTRTSPPKAGFSAGFVYLPSAFVIETIERAVE